MNEKIKKEGIPVGYQIKGEGTSISKFNKN